MTMRPHFEPQYVEMNAKTPLSHVIRCDWASLSLNLHGGAAVSHVVSGYMRSCPLPSDPERDFAGNEQKVVV